MKNILVPAVYLIAFIEHKGVRLDTIQVLEYQKALRAKMTELEGKISRLFGKKINVRSTDQLSRAITEFGWDALFELTPTGKVQLRKDHLKARASEDSPVGEFCRYLLEFRAADKGASTFISNLLRSAQVDTRVHSHYLLHGTETGRLSSQNPNMQNLPEEVGGFHPKKVLIPDSGYLFFNVDFKGAELRVAAAYSRDPKYISDISQGLDLHSLLASQVFGHPYEEYATEDRTPERSKERKLIKRAVFGTLYGASHYKIAEILQIELSEAQRIVDTLFAAYPGIKNYILRTQEEVKRQRYVTTFFGRERHFPPAFDWRELSAQFREAVNFKIQSTASDITLRQAALLNRELLKRDLGMVLGLVHDAIFGQIREDREDEFKKLLHYYLVEEPRQSFEWLPVPLEYDLKIAKTYGG